MLPNTKSNIGNGLNNVNGKDNNVLNTSFETYQKEISAEQKGTPRMRTMVRTGKLESSATGNIDSSQVTANRYIKDQVTGHFVSARYNSRRLRAITYNLRVEFGSELRYGEGEIKTDLFSRRMSAPELPPISSNGKNSAIINNSNLTTRNNTFHNYKFQHKNRKIIHSDSSLQGFTSRASSPSSQTSRNRVQSAGTERLLQPANHAIIADIIKEKPPIQKITEVRDCKEDMPAAATRVARCPPAPSFKRSKSKISVNGYNNLTTPRSIVHSHSATQLNPGRGDNGKKQSVGIKRNSSDNRITELIKRNARTSGAASVKKDSQPIKKGPSNNLNGLRRYSSTLILNSNDKSDESEAKKDVFDSDSDTEKDSRVIDWIIGVHEVAEPPEEQVIDYEDEPPQRDTAIRIVYEGDT